LLVWSFAADLGVRPTLIATALFLAYVWLMHVLVTIPVVAPVIWFARHRVRWYWWEALVFILPFTVWMTLMFTSLRPKSIANIGEALMISIGIAAAVLIRLMLGKAGHDKRIAALLLLGVVGVAVGVYFLTQLWPEVERAA
jgi:hypothetical protein